MKKLLLCLAIMALACPAALVLAQETPVKGGRLVVSQPAEPPGLDPTANTAAAIDRVVYANVYEGLVKVDRQGNYIPGLAAGWTMSPDGKVYTFKIRQGVKFHNGEPFSAQVAAWSLERAKAEKTQNAHPEYFRGIVAIETPDEATLKLTLKASDALFIAHLAEGDAVMLPQGYAAKSDEGEAKGAPLAQNLKNNPIGTGPFKFVKWAKGDSVELERFEGYWNPKLPYLDRLVVKFIPDPNAQAAALKAGDIDAIDNIAPESAVDLAKDQRFKVLNGLATNEAILSTNNKAKPFDNIKVRQAMAYAIDRKQVVDLAMFGFGQPIGSHWSSTTPYYKDLTGLFPYNPDKAKALLKEAGYEKGFEAVLKLPAQYAYARRSGEVVADMLSKVGIKLKLEVIEWGQWIERVFKGKDYQLTVIGHSEPWDITIYGNPNYYFQYDSKPFQETLQKALTAASEADKAKYFQECQEIIAQDAVNGYLFSVPYLPAMKAAVMGWWENAPTINMDCTEVWIKK